MAIDSKIVIIDDKEQPKDTREVTQAKLQGLQPLREEIAILSTKINDLKEQASQEAELLRQQHYQKMPNIQKKSPHEKDEYKRLEIKRILRNLRLGK